VRVPSVTPEEGWAARRAIFEPHLEAQGITPESIAKETKAEIRYKEPITLLDGTVKKVLSPAAMKIRQAAVDRYHKLCGHYAPEKMEVDHGVKGLTDEQLDSIILKIIGTNGHGPKPGE
jgi:hypothetical protein